MMPEHWSRRSLLRGTLSLVGAAGVAGCGFHPVYMPTASGRPGPASRDLATIDVARIPDRPGQLLRQALRQRFGSDSAAAAPEYMLAVSYSIAGEGISVEVDSTPSRIRLIGHAAWTLSSLAPSHARITAGSARAFEGLDVMDQQYFAADLGTEAVQQRLAGAIADEIAMQLAVFFRRRAAAG